MIKAIALLVILLLIAGAVFALGFVLGSTMTPLG